MSKHICPVGYVQVNDTRTIQKLILQLMVQFHDICEKHHLVYNLLGGSLLGAVRHKGFIPWDDDMDVCMPRDDYEKFIRIAKAEYKDDFITFAPGDEGYSHVFTKICLKDTILYEPRIIDKYSLGVYLDVFPYDEYPGDQVAQTDGCMSKIRMNAIKLGASRTTFTPSSVWWRKIFVIAKPFVCGWYRYIGAERFVKEYVDSLPKYKSGICDCLTLWCVHYYKLWISKYKYYERVLYDFEGYKFWSVKDYDDWLTRIYGDYMTPPPPEKRVQYHGFELFVKKEILESL